MAIYGNSGKQVIDDRYLAYFKKKHGCRIVRTRGQNKVSDLIDLDSSNHRVSNHTFQICINDSASSKLAIQNKESNVAIIDEGLIATYPTSKVLEHFKKTFAKEVAEDLVDSRFEDSIEKLIDFVEMSDPNQTISPIIVVCIPAKNIDD